MSPIDVYQKAIELIEKGHSFALASVVSSLGSTPQKTGANAIFEPAGKIWGTLGGGCLEAESKRRALQALDHGTPLAFELKLDEITGWDDGLICGGKVKILVDPNLSKNLEAYRAMLHARTRREQGVLFTVIQHADYEMGTAIWVPERAFHDHPISSEIGETARLLEKGEATLYRGSGQDPSQDMEIFVEPVIYPPRLVIAGAGHIGKATAHLASRLGFEVTVIDDRPALASKTNLPEADHAICGDIPKEMAALELGPDSYVVIVTRGHRHDGAVLAACIRKPAAYIGMIGSRRKGTLIRKALVEEGIATPEEMDRVVSPIGLDLGGETVEEIALSIVAQLVAYRRRRCLEAGSLNYLAHDKRHRARRRGIQTDGPAETVVALR